jgi:chemotaxis protein methyltransferase CheR
MKPKEIESLEIDIFLDAINKRYGYDFQNYAPASLRRRIGNQMKNKSCEHILDLLSLVIHDEKVFEDLLKELSITVTEMFRDPGFFVAVRENIFPMLKTYPFLKIWHAGCATGEEVYSMAILLKEADLLSRTQIYATDFNNHSLEFSRKAIYSKNNIQKYIKNYNEVNGEASFSNYYHANYGHAKLVDSLKENVTFANHNLVSDGVFGEMHLIICRNVLIYFNKELQNRVLKIFSESLIHRGFLCLGSKESIDFLKEKSTFENVNRTQRIFRKK